MLITGGTGALGLLIASWLVGRQGVKQVTLVSRSGRAATAADQAHKALQHQLTALQSAEATLSITAADVAASEDTGAVLNNSGLVGASSPVFGIIHASGVLQDASLRNQSMSGLMK